MARRGRPTQCTRFTDQSRKTNAPIRPLRVTALRAFARSDPNYELSPTAATILDTSEVRGFVKIGPLSVCNFMERSAVLHVEKSAVIPQIRNF